MLSEAEKERLEAEKANAANKAEYEKGVADCLRTFSTAHGRRYLKSMREKYCGHISRDDDMAFNLGRREVVKDIEAIIILGKNPGQIDDYFRMPEDDGFKL